MHQILANSGRRAYGVKTYVVQTIADMNAIPLFPTVLPGSTVFVLSTGAKYILTRERRWVKIRHDTSADSEEDTSNEIIYEGGDINIDNGVSEADLDYDGGSVE